MAGQGGFFDIEERLAGLSRKGDGLERLNSAIDFELFRPELERAVPRADRSKGGRPPFDHVLMFKVLTLQTLSNLSDERTEFFLRDRLTWIRFLGLGLGDPVPDANTIWTFREALTKAGAIERLFTLFDEALCEAGYLAMSGQLGLSGISCSGHDDGKEGTLAWHAANHRSSLMSCSTNCWRAGIRRRPSAGTA
jgi:transposase, IS5 family